MDQFGKPKPFGYTIYLKPVTYISLLKKRRAVDELMTDMMLEDVKVPCNISLHDQYIIQLSLFPRDGSRPEKSPYYGIHVLDEDQEIAPGRGLNFTQIEYDGLMEMLQQWKEMVKLQLDEEDEPYSEPKPSKRRKKDVSISEPGPSVADAVDSVDGDHDAGEGNGDADGGYDGQRVIQSGEHLERNLIPPFTSKKRRLGVFVYGWEWVKNGEEMQFPTTGQSQGQWFVDPKKCFYEAGTYTPSTPNCKLETFAHKLNKTIGLSMIEACLAHLIREKIGAIKEHKNEEFADDDLEKFGVEALNSIGMDEVFDRCKRVITFYQKNQKWTNEYDLWFMKMLTEYPKDDDILETMKCGYLDEIFSQVFAYIE